MKSRWTASAVAAALFFSGIVLAGERFVIEAVLVRVNDSILTVGDFRTRLEVEVAQYPTPPSGDDLREFARKLFESIVDEMVLLERASEKRIKVEDEMLDRQIQGLREENGLQDDQQFEQALLGAGLTEEKLRERYRKTMLIQRAAQSEVSPTEITEEELRQRYEEDKERFRIPRRVTLEQLFFPIAADGSNRDETLRLAQALVERAQNGNDFRAEATLAGLEVQDLGSIPDDDLRAELLEVLSQMEPGDLSQPIDTGGGLQVIRLMDRMPAGFEEFDDVKEAIRRQVSMEAYEEQTRGVVERLKEEYLVEIFEERLTQLFEASGNPT
jgi:peptidyl-prolyl cis-trans isomerase SurA